MDRSEHRTYVDVEVTDWVHRLERTGLSESRSKRARQKTNDGSLKASLARTRPILPPDFVELRGLPMAAVPLSRPDSRGMADASKRIAEHDSMVRSDGGKQHRDRAAIAVTEDDDPLAAHRTMTVVMSSIQRSMVGIAPSGTGSDMPVPRLSKQITRPIVAKRSRKRASSGSSHMISMLLG
jgi:hypothetical protein